MIKNNNTKIKELVLKILKEEMLLLEQDTDNTDTSKLKVGDSYREPGDEDVRYEVKGIEGDLYNIGIIENGKYVSTRRAKIYNIDTFIEDGIYEIIKQSKDSIKKEKDSPTEESPKEETPKEEEPSTEDDSMEDAPKEKGATTWEKIKWVLGKLGAYKVDGNILGKKKIRKEAEEKIKNILDKKSNELIKNVDEKIKEENPEFPNNVKGEDFLSSVLSIAACYDSIVESAKKDDANKLPVDAANEIINDLREYVKKVLDVDLSASYSTLDENTEEEEVNEDAASDAREKLKADRAARTAGSQDTKDFKSSKIDTLKSNKLPLTLAGVGASFGAFSWLVNTDWFRGFFEKLTTENYTQLVEKASEKITDIKQGEGVYKLLGRVTGTELNGTSSPQAFIDSLEQIGGGNAEKGLELLCQKGGVMMKPEQAAEGLKKLIENPENYKNLNEFFQGETSGTGKLTPTDTTIYGTMSGRQLTSVIIKMVPEIFTKSAIKVGAGYAVAKGLGSVLGPIGVGLVAAGAIVKLMRMKGLRQSRAATLNALYQSLRNLPGGGIVKPEGPVDQSIKIPPTEAPVGQTVADINTDRDSVQNAITAIVPDVETDKSKKEPSEKPKEKEDTVGTSTAGEEEKKDKEKEEPATGEKEAPKEKEKAERAPKDTSEDGDTLYKILKNTFKYVVDNKNTLSSKSDAPSPEKKKSTKKVKLTDKQKVAVIKNLKNSGIVKKTNFLKKLYGRGVDIDSTASFLVKNDILTKEVADEIVNKIKNAPEEVIAEGRYIKNDKVITYASKKLTYKKVQAFEKLMRKLELIRDKVKAIKDVKDPKLQSIIRKFDSNPLMDLNFREAFNVRLEDTEEVDSLVTFIDDMFSTLYTKSYEKSNLVDKAATVLGGPIVEAFEKAYIQKGIYETYLKSTKYRTGIKRHIIVFLVNAFKLFKYLDEKLKEKK